MPQISARILFLSAAVLATGCGKPQQQQKPPPPEVGVVPAHAQAVPLTQELTGRLAAVRSADVRARVAGVLRKRAYVEGSDVKQGQLLFEIDPAPMRAAYNAQLANLAAAQATYTNAHVAAERARSIGAKGLLSKSDVDNANAAERTAAAAVKQAQANAESARINLDYTNVTAPIAGRAGQQQVTEGALVGQGEATLLARIDQVDPLYVNFTLAVGELDRLRASAASGSVDLAEPDKAKLELLLPGGAVYSEPGVLDFSDQAVDAATGAVSLRGTVPNPQHRLLPGQFVNVRLTLGDLKHAWLVSQRAVQRDANGPYVLVVGADGNVAQKQIKAERLRGDSWIVTDGLVDGDQVIVSGLQRVKPGEPAKAAPWQPTPTAAK